MPATPSIPSRVFMAPDTLGPGGPGAVPQGEQQPGTDPAPNIEEVRRRIAKALAEGLDELDLGGLGLREVPEEIFALTDLKRLHLGRATTGGSAGTSGVGEARNRLAAIDPRLFTKLTKLQVLDL